MAESLDQFNALSNDEKLKVIEYGMYMVQYFKDNDVNESISTLLDQRIRAEVARGERKLNAVHVKEKEETKKMQDQLIRELDIKQEQLVKMKKEYEHREKEDSRKLQDKYEKELTHREEYINKLKRECEVLSELSNRGTSEIITKITDVHKDLNQLLQPGKKGRVGEVLLYNLLSDEFPGCMVKDVTKRAGCCDLLMEYKNVRFVIESKMNTYETLKSHPTETIERFKKDVCLSIEGDSCNIGVFVAHMSHTIPGKGIMDVEECYSPTVGKYFLLYVCDTNNHPSRLKAVIELGRHLYMNIDKNKKTKAIIDNVARVNLKVGIAIKNIQEMKSSINQQYKVCKSLESNLDDMHKMLNGMDYAEDSNDAVEITKLERVADIYKNIRTSGRNVTIKALRDEITRLGLGIPPNVIGRGIFTMANIRKHLLMKK